MPHERLDLYFQQPLNYRHIDELEAFRATNPDGHYGDGWPDERPHEVHPDAWGLLVGSRRKAVRQAEMAEEKRLREVESWKTTPEERESQDKHGNPLPDYLWRDPCGIVRFRGSGKPARLVEDKFEAPVHPHAGGWKMDEEMTAVTKELREYHRQREQRDAERRQREDDNAARTRAAEGE